MDNFSLESAEDAARALKRDPQCYFYLEPETAWRQLRESVAASIGLMKRLEIFAAKSPEMQQAYNSLVKAEHCLCYVEPERFRPQAREEIAGADACDCVSAIQEFEAQQQMQWASDWLNGRIGIPAKFFARNDVKFIVDDDSQLIVGQGAVQAGKTAATADCVSAPNESPAAAPIADPHPELSSTEWFQKMMG